MTMSVATYPPFSAIADDELSDRDETRREGKRSGGLARCATTATWIC